MNARVALIAAFLGGVSTLTQAYGESPSSQPADFLPEVFDYERPTVLDVQDNTAAMRTRMTGLRQRLLVFTDTRGEKVPILVSLPSGGTGPFPAVVLAHGFSSDKEGVSRQLARALTAQGMACLAPDLPHHGARPGTPSSLFPEDAPDVARRNVIQAVTDLRQTIDVAETTKEVDTSQGVYLVGYSMGSWLGTLTAASDRRIKAIVLMVAGSAAITSNSRKEEGPGISSRLDLVHRYPELRHNLAIARISPRPLLMQNGKKDVLVPSERAKAIFDAAGDPKEHRWYDSGHMLPAPAYQEAAEWLKKLRGEKVRK